MVNDGQVPEQSVPGRVPAPSSWLVPAVIATVCCFSPTGLIAVYYASRVGAAWSYGDTRAAWRYSELARRWVWISVLLWAVFLFILVATGRMGRLLEAGVV